MNAHTRSTCPEILADTFWLPSYCPRGLAMGMDRLDTLVDCHTMTWTGGRYVTTNYRCPCCGTEWEDDDWLAWVAFGAVSMKVPPETDAPITITVADEAEIA